MKRSNFRHVFNTNFNIGFGSPRTEVCSTCTSLDERLKYTDDLDKKKALFVEKRIHTLKAQSFYTYLKEKRDDLLIFSFDCQKNQVLPKVPDQSAYFSRQLYQYNLAITVGDSKCPETKENTFLYEWKENEHLTGSNKIASGLFHCLTNHQYAEKITHIRFVCDRCGGQNKNRTMMGMVQFWLSKKAPDQISTVEIIFPIVGH